MELLPIYIFIEFPSERQNDSQIQERYLNFFSFPSGHDQLYKTPPGQMKLFDDSTNLSDSSRNLPTPCVILSGRKSLSIDGNRPVPLFPSPLSIPSLNPSADGRWSFVFPWNISSIRSWITF